MLRKDIEKLIAAKHKSRIPIPDFCFADSGDSLHVMFDPVEVRINGQIRVMDRCSANIAKEKERVAKEKERVAKEKERVAKEKIAEGKEKEVEVEAEEKFEILGSATLRKEKIEKWLYVNTGFDYRPVNILFFGQKQAGKTALMRQLINKTFSENEKDSSISMPLPGYIKTLPNKYTPSRVISTSSFEHSIKTTSMDSTEGAHDATQEADGDTKYASMDIAVFVLDANQEIDEETIALYSEVKQKLPNNCRIQFVVNKCDLIKTADVQQEAVNKIAQLGEKLHLNIDPLLCYGVSARQSIYGNFSLSAMIIDVDRQRIMVESERTDLENKIINYLSNRIDAMQPYWFTRALRAVKNFFIGLFIEVKPSEEPQKSKSFRDIRNRLIQYPKVKDTNVPMETLQSTLSDIKSVAEVHRSESGFKSLFTGLHNPTSLNVFERDLAPLQSPVDNDKQPPVGSSSTGNSSSK